MHTKIVFIYERLNYLSLKISIIHVSDLTNVLVPPGKSVYTNLKFIYYSFLSHVLLPKKTGFFLDPLIWTCSNHVIPSFPLASGLFSSIQSSLRTEPVSLFSWPSVLSIGLLRYQLILHSSLYSWLLFDFVPCLQQYFQMMSIGRFFHDLPLNKRGWLIFWWIINKSI